jgi:hypothetical protein
MRKTLIVKLVFSFLLVSSLMGCLIVPEDEHRRGEGFEEHRGEHHEHGEERR